MGGSPEKKKRCQGTRVFAVKKPKQGTGELGGSAQSKGGKEGYGKVQGKQRWGLVMKVRKFSKTGTLER